MKFDKLLAVIAANPGLNATQLRERGLWKPRRSPSLKEAEDAGVIEYRNEGWFPKAPATRYRKDCAKYDAMDAAFATARECRRVGKLQRKAKS